MKINKVNNENIGNYLLDGDGKYYKNSVKEVITDNGYVIGLSKDDEVMVSQIVCIGTISTDLTEIGYENKITLNNNQIEKMFNKLVDNLSIPTENDFSSVIDEYSYYGCEEKLMEKIENLIEVIL